MASSDVIDEIPNVNWNSIDLGILHSAFYVGLMLTHIPAGLISSFLPAHNLFCGSIFMSSMLNFVLPISISKSFLLTLVVRFLQGCCEAFYFPTSHVLIRRWSPPQERSIIGSIIYSGIYGGAVLGFPLNSLIAYYFGQQYAYYVFTIIGFIWSLIFHFNVYETPSKHQTISSEELEFIERSKNEADYIFHTEIGHRSIPWFQILTSKPVWAINVAQFAASWTYCLLLSNQTVYFSIYGYDLAENGIIAAFPHLVKVIFVLMSGFIADYLRKKKISTTNVRKLMTCTGFIVQAVCFASISFTNDSTYSVCLITIGTGFSGLMVSGWRINHQDIACSYAGILAGISASVGDLAGILNPIVTGYLTKNQTLQEWQFVLVVCSTFLLFASFFYSTNASGLTQNWAIDGSLNQQIILINSRKVPVNTKLS